MSARIVGMKDEFSIFCSVESVPAVPAHHIIEGRELDGDTLVDTDFEYSPQKNRSDAETLERRMDRQILDIGIHDKSET